jgi:hypothetical protein
MFSNMNQDIIKDQVSNMYLWPKNLVVQIMDDARYFSWPPW